MMMLMTEYNFLQYTYLERYGKVSRFYFYMESKWQKQDKEAAAVGKKFIL